MATHMDEYLRCAEDGAAALNAHVKAEATRQKAATVKLTTKLDDVLQRVTTLEGDSSALKDKVESLEAELTVVKNEHKIELARINRDLGAARQENDQLQLVIADQNGVVGQLAKRIDPYGLWRWVTRTGPDAIGGSWRWLMTVPPRRAAAIRSSADIFLALPSELLDMITSLLTKEDKFRLVLVSYKWFDILAQELYSTADINEGNLGKFLKAKLIPTSSFPTRLSQLHKIETLHLRRTDQRDLPLSHHLALPLQPVPQEVWLETEDLKVHIANTGLLSDLDYWYNVLVVCDPQRVYFSLVQTEGEVRLPTVVPVTVSVCGFAQQWAQLEQAYFYGPESVPVVEGNPTSLALPARQGARSSSWSVVTAFADADLAKVSEKTTRGLGAVLDKIPSLVVGPDVEDMGVLVEWVNQKKNEDSADLTTSDSHVSQT